MLLGFCAVAGAGHAEEAVPVYRQFGDWLAVCDNVRGCELKLLPEESGEAADHTLSVLRAAGPGAMPVLHLRNVTQDATPAHAPAHLLLDGKRLAASPAAGPDGETLSAPRTDTVGLLRRIGQGKVLAWSGARLSLHGLAAALLLCDAVQGRTGGATALARPGPLPAAAVPAAPQLPAVRAAPAPAPLQDARALAAAVRRGQTALLSAQGCDPPDSADQDSAAPLNARDAVVLLICNMAAYQSDELAFRVPRDAPAGAALLHLPPPPRVAGAAPTAGPGSATLTEAAYDPDTAVLSQSAKGRGIADCGEATEWTFDGAAFVLSAYSLQIGCGGAPGDWPVLVRTGAVR